MPRDYRVFLDDIGEAVGKVIDYTASVTEDRFAADKKTVEAVLWNLQVIGEAAKHIPNSIRNNYPQIPWRDMAALRDVLAHDYFGVNLSVIWKIAKNDAPLLRDAVQNLIRVLGS